MNSKVKLILRSLLFFVILFALLIGSGFYFVPKWRGIDAELPRGFYHEEEDSLDVLLIGSCNIYTSFSPLLAYKDYGFKSYVFGTPDQDLNTSYYYFKEGLKSQKEIDVVVLESLFFTLGSTPKREYYNRTALDHMPFSLNKLQAIFDIGKEEAEFMSTVDPTAPSEALTYAGYIFPTLRYHNRDDLTQDDIDFWFDDENYRYTKGTNFLRSFIKNDTLSFNGINNGTEIKDLAKEYFLKIKDLAEDEGVKLIVVNSPNFYRWNRELVDEVKYFVEDHGVEFIDYFGNDDFTIYDVSEHTGRLNVYGVKKYTRLLSEELMNLKELEIKPATESVNNSWNQDIDRLYEELKNNKYTIDEGEIAFIKGEEDGLFIKWNDFLDDQTYHLYRALNDTEDYKLVVSTKDDYFLDTDVIDGEHYKYYLESLVQSEQSYSRVNDYVFLEPVDFVEKENSEEGLEVTWDNSHQDVEYILESKRNSSMNFSRVGSFEENQYTYTGDNPESTDFRVIRSVTVDDRQYYSKGCPLFSYNIND